MLKRRLFLGFIGLALLLSLASYVLKNTKIQIQSSDTGMSSIGISTQFPEATCQKSLKASFPFVQFHCSAAASPKPEQILNDSLPETP